MTFVTKRRQRNREEDRELEKLAAWLRERGLLFTHPANEEPDRIRAAIAKRKGVQAGVPDILVFDERPPMLFTDGGSDLRHLRGAAIELKAKGRYPTAKQKEWLRRLEANGWATLVCNTADEAVEWLAGLGY